MKSSKRDIERLISLSLDGELSDEEQLSLNRELIRDPSAQRMMDAYRAADRMVVDALQSSIPERDGSFDPTVWIGEVSQVSGRRVVHRGWWLAVGSMAAALLAVVLNLDALGLANTGTVGSEMAGPGGIDVDGGSVPLSNGSGLVASDGDPSGLVPRVGGGQDIPRVGAGGDALMHNVSLPPRQRVRRDVARDLYGIMGRKGVFYFIEVDHTRTVKRPHPESVHRPVLGDM
ncbi:MAG: anti-sigma factor family protein [Planctomycetota bacterium]